MRIQKFLALVLSVALMVSIGAAASGTTVNELPRNETLYVFDHWGSVNGWNPIGVNQNNGLAIKAEASGSRTTMFETLYMYNPMDGSLVPLLADGDYVWNDDMTELTVRIKDAAKWSDGTDLTAYDVAYTFDTGIRIQNGTGTKYGAYIAAVEAVDAKTVLIKAALDADGSPVNPLLLLDYLSGTFVAQKAWIETLEARTGGDASAMLNDPADDVVWSGPYTKYFVNDQKIVLVRDDNYWGQDESMWGKLPVPKYLVTPIMSDNNSALVAFKAGDIDVTQMFIPNVQDLWLKDELPISTYMEEAPYGVCSALPTAWFNMNVPALNNVSLRKAIAIAVDYDAVIQNAMTNQSPTFTEAPRSCMNPTEGEQAIYNHEAVADLQWTGNDIDGAIALLDAAGIVDSDGDGWRELNGEKISLNACCPNGWSDWQAAMEIVAAAGSKIGIEITTLYPEWSIYQTVFTSPTQTEYDIFMWSATGSAPSATWTRVRQLMSSEFNGVENNWSGNWGHYSNTRADEIVKAIPTMADPDELKALYTEAVEIYLSEVPSFTLMYRPSMFYAVNESVWTNFPSADDGRNIPPMLCTDGYSISALYDLELINP